MTQLFIQSVIVIALLGACNSNLTIKVGGDENALTAEGKGTETETQTNTNTLGTSTSSGTSTSTTSAPSASLVAPSLSSVSTGTDVYFTENSSSGSIADFGDEGDDTDADGNAITYQCWFDQTPDDSVSELVANECNSTNLNSLSFDTSTGVLTAKFIKTQVGRGWG